MKRKINSKLGKSMKMRMLVSATAFALLAGSSLALSYTTDVYATGLEDAVDTYRVKFINYDGEELLNETYPEGTIIEEPVVPERIGFTFVGWSPAFDSVVGNESVVYNAMFEGSDDITTDTQVNDDVMIYNESGSTQGSTSNDTGFTNFLFMVILFLMETVWLHDRRSQQMRRYDTVMSMMDKE